jgi:hypothetical protein
VEIFPLIRCDPELIRLETLCGVGADRGEVPKGSAEIFFREGDVLE